MQRPNHVNKVTFIAPELPHWNFVTYALFPEYGMPLVATIVKNAGYDVRVFVERIGPVKWGRVLESDVVCVHAFSATMPKAIQYAGRIRAARPDVPVIMGGTHASVLVEDTLQYCDVVVRQEGDETLLDVLEAMKNGRDLSGVLGISYWDNGRVRHNPDRPYVTDLETIPDLELIDGYLAWPLLKRLLHQRMRMQVLQTSRGCPYDCSFCITPRELGRGYRLREIDNVIADIKYQINLVGARRFFIVDNLFTANRERTKKLLNRIIDEKIEWSATCFARIEVARDEELLALLWKARIRVLYLGLESFDDHTLRAFNKHQTAADIRQSLQRIRAHGLKALGSFIVGSDVDTVETIRGTADAAIAEDLEYLVLFPLHGFPEHNSSTIPLNRFVLPTWDRLDAGHVVYLPKLMRPSTLQREIIRAYRRFYGPAQVWRRIRRGDYASALQRVAFAYWVSRMGREMEAWAKELERLEDPYYDDRGRLVEERLGAGLHPAKYPGTARLTRLGRRDGG